jgi:hypothetical protein
MKKVSLTAIREFLDKSGFEEEHPEIMAELDAELNRGAEKAQANRELYDAAKEVVMSELGETPVTIGELYDALADKLPEGFSKSKLQYGVTRLWTADIARIEGKVNTYRKA